MTDLLTRPVFILSLDMELGWGFASYPGHKVLGLQQSNPKRARGTIDLLLEILEKHDLKATWAVVGHLFFGPGEEKGLVSKEMPQFGEGYLDWDFYERMKSRPQLYYGRGIVEKILASRVKHEIGLHGFLHIPFDQCSREVASAEAEMGLKAANNLGIIPNSFVFPENRIGHVDILRDHGFQIYRGSNLRWWSKDQKFLIHKFDIAAHSIIATPASPSNNNGIWEIPGSTYFFEPRLPFTVPWRARLGLYRAIRAKKVFHIWLHCWSLLLYERLSRDLDEFLALVAQKRDDGKLEVMTMGELASCLESGG